MKKVAYCDYKPNSMGAAKEHLSGVNRSSRSNLIFLKGWANVASLHAASPGLLCIAHLCV